MKYYILVRRKGTKRWLGAIPAKSGVSLARLKQVVRRVTRPGFQAKVVTQATFKRLMTSLVKKRRMSIRRNVRHSRSKSRSKSRARRTRRTVRHVKRHQRHVRRHVRVHRRRRRR